MKRSPTLERKKDEAPASPPVGMLPALVLGSLAAGYFLWFTGATERRRALLAILQNPLDIVAQWLGPAGTPLGLLDRVPVLAMSGLVLLAGYGLGRCILDRARLAAGCSHLERGVFAAAIGLNGLSTLVLLAGLAGWLSQRWLLILLVGGLAACAAVQASRDILGVTKSTEKHIAPRAVLAWLALPFVVILILGACLPPWDFDVREYHLQVPKEWLAQGRVTFLPHNVYGNMPLGAEMHALLAMALWPGEHGWFYGALAGKVVIAALAIIAALGIALAGERLAGKTGGALATVLFLAHPWVIHVSVNGLNDGALATYVFLSLYAMWLARAGKCSYLLAGLLAGGAAACKYPGAVFAVVPLAIWAILPVSGIGASATETAAALPPAPQSWLGRAMPLVLIAAGVLLGGGAWYAKNAALTGNPIYPLAYRIFGGATRTPEKNVQWSKAHQVPPDSHGYRYSLEQLGGSMARIAGRDDFASPLFLPLLAAAGFALVASRRANPSNAAGSLWPLVRMLAGGMLWILVVWWLVSHRLDRFLLPVWPLAAVLAAGAWRLEDHAWRRAVQVILFVGWTYCLLAASSQLVGDNRWFVALEQLRSDGPWPAGTPLRISPVHQWLNERALPGEAVLLVGDAAPFDLTMPAHYHTCFDGCLLCDWLLDKSADERKRELADRRIAWVVVDWPEIARYQSPGNYGFDPRFTPALVEELVTQGVLGPPESLVPHAPGARRPVEIYPVLPASSVATSQ
jgi:hypothetical protein